MLSSFYRVLDLSHTYAWSSWVGQIFSNLGAVVKKLSLDTYYPSQIDELKKIIDQSEILIVDMSKEEEANSVLSYTRLKLEFPKIIFCHIADREPLFFQTQDRYLSDKITQQVISLLSQALQRPHRNKCSQYIDLRTIDEFQGEAIRASVSPHPIPVSSSQLELFGSSSWA